jgi:hypothetical protein
MVFFPIVGTFFVRITRSFILCPKRVSRLILNNCGGQFASRQWSVIMYLMPLILTPFAGVLKASLKG